MPSLRQIRYFLSVAEHGGFTPAAAALFIAQPALSRQIALLEAELKVQLFIREARGVSLTAAGSLLQERFRNIEKSLSAAVEESRQIEQGAAGILRLLHSSSVPIERLLPAIQAFHEQAPLARIDLDRISSEQQIREIAQGKADIGLIRLPVLHRDPVVRIIELAAEPLYLAMPSGHPLSACAQPRLIDLAEYPFVSAVHRERGGLARRVTDLCLSRGFVPRTAPVISRKTSMLTLVGVGFGIAVVPESMTQSAISGVIFHRLVDADTKSSSALVLPQRNSPLAERFVAIAKSLWTIKQP